MKEVFWVGLGGFLGANARYFVAGWVATRVGSIFPYGTLLINATGSFALGVLMGLAETSIVSPTIRLGLGIGFLGAYTTFSTFSYETLRLAEDGSLLLAAANAVGSVTISLLAALAGLLLGRAL